MISILRIGVNCSGLPNLNNCYLISFGTSLLLKYFSNISIINCKLKSYEKKTFYSNSFVVLLLYC